MTWGFHLTSELGPANHQALLPEFCILWGEAPGSLLSVSLLSGLKVMVFTLWSLESLGYLFLFCLFVLFFEARIGVWGHTMVSGECFYFCLFYTLDTNNLFFFFFKGLEVPKREL